MNRVKSLICSATRVAPAVRAADTVGLGWGAGLDRDDRPRVWANAAEGDKRSVISRVMAIRFKVFSSSTGLKRELLLCDGANCTKDQCGC
jgi:hypothetical protein